jgi:hypothetical protein
MQPQVRRAYHQGEQTGHRLRRARSSLPILLWALWTFAIVAVGYLNWHADVVAQRPIDTVGLVIHCVVAGIIGLVIMTKVEMHLEPWRFLGE